MYDFFFQAEDGIRDLTVTGVQKCALPISEDPAWLQTCVSLAATVRAVMSVPPPGAKGTTKVTGRAGHACAKRFVAASSRASGIRSEERRVGNERRARWGTDRMRDHNVNSV